MAVTPNQITAQIRLATPTFVGKDWLKVTKAIGTAVHTWMIVPANVQLQGVPVGVLGGGAVPTGKIVVSPMVSAMKTAFSSFGLNGKDSIGFSKGVALGVANAINASGEYYGTSIGVGNGVESCKAILANQKSLETQLRTSFAAARIKGRDSKNLAKAISVGVSSIILTGVGTAAVTGSPSPIPSSGTTILFMR